MCNVPLVLAEGSIRLFPLYYDNTNTYLISQLEILYDGHWGTVCDDKWDERDGDVACSQLFPGRQTDSFIPPSLVFR